MSDVQAIGNDLPTVPADLAGTDQPRRWGYVRGPNSPPIEPDPHGIFGALAVEKCLAAGLVVNAGRFLDGDTSLVRAARAKQTPEALGWLERSRGRLAELRAYETLHGPYSAVIEDHPFTLTLRRAYWSNDRAWPPRP